MLRTLACVGVVLALAAAAAADPPSPLDPPSPTPPPASVIDEMFALRSPPDRPGAWAELDYLLWWRKPVCEPPATVTLGNPNDAVPGAVGQPGTVTVLGSTRFEFQGASGVRPTVGVWLTDSWGLVASGIILPRSVTTRGFSSDGRPAYLPYVTVTNANAAIPWAIPGRVEASSTESGSTQLYGAEVSALGRMKFYTAGGTELTGGLLLGGRYLYLEDQVVLKGTQALVAPPYTVATAESRFTTRNQFAGPQVGLQAAAGCGRWGFEYTQKLAFGMTRMQNIVSGGPLTGGQPVGERLLPGPLLAEPSNVGTLTTSRATIVPELNLTVRYRVAEGVQLSLGYNLLYWNRIFCPGDLMDRVVNLTQLPGFGPLEGSARPTQSFARTDYFAQGLQAGVAVEY